MKRLCVVFILLLAVFACEEDDKNVPLFIQLSSEARAGLDLEIIVGSLLFARAQVVTAQDYLHGLRKEPMAPFIFVRCNLLTRKRWNAFLDKTASPLNENAATSILVSIVSLLVNILK